MQFSGYGGKNMTSQASNSEQIGITNPTRSGFSVIQDFGHEIMYPSLPIDKGGGDLHFQ